MTAARLFTEEIMTRRNPEEKFQPIVEVESLWSAATIFETQCWERKDGVTNRAGHRRVIDVKMPYIADSSEWHGEQGLFTYQINSNDFVGPEFHKNPHILALGCSVTASCGLPHEFTWPHIIGKYLDKKVNVLAYPGSGIKRCIENAFFHMREFGVPQQIMLLAPDLERMSVFNYKRERSKSGWFGWEKQNLTWDDEYDAYRDPETMIRNDFHFRPLVWKNVLKQTSDVPVDLAYAQSLTWINAMRNVCELLGVELRVGTWHQRTWKSFQTMNDPIFVTRGRDFFADQECCNPAMAGNARDYFSNECHNPAFSLQEQFWREAADRPFGHPGVHPHIHFAELMMGATLPDEFIKEIQIGERKNSW